MLKEKTIVTTVNDERVDFKMDELGIIWGSFKPNIEYLKVSETERQISFHEISETAVYERITLKKELFIELLNDKKLKIKRS